jgi:CelD/BcsL family acetyltransferase involved in cellulose biosynthesis
LRRCRRHWEPVAYQCVPGAIAPAVDTPALGRALNALGVEVRVNAGLGPEVELLAPRYSWKYVWYKVDLQSDYEAHWRAKKRQYTVRRARKQCADMQQRIDGAGDLEWIIAQWRTQWADDPGQEVVAAGDRVRFWGALMRAPPEGGLGLHTLQLLSREGKRAAGLIFTSNGDTVMLQCGGREPEFDDSYARAYLHIAAIEWAKQHGFKFLDLAAGDFKRLWGPEGGVRYGAIFRPPLIDAFTWANPEPKLAPPPQSSPEPHESRAAETSNAGNEAQG